MWLPPAVLLCLVLFQVILQTAVGHFVWLTNASIISGFGAAFSFGLLRMQSRIARVEGGCFLLLYGVVAWVTYLLISPNGSLS
jgi:hypothetical protein